MLNVTVFLLNGSDPVRNVPQDKALEIMADRLGYDVSTLHVNNYDPKFGAYGWVSHWSFQDAGSIVGRIG